MPRNKGRDSQSEGSESEQNLNLEERVNAEKSMTSQANQNKEAKRESSRSHRVRDTNNSSAVEEESEYESSPESIPHTSHTPRGSIKIIHQSELSSPEPELLAAIAVNMSVTTEDYQDFKKRLDNEAEQNSERDSTGQTPAEKLEAENNTETSRSMETNQDETPKSITIEMVWTMFNELKQEFTRSRQQDQAALSTLKRRS